MRSFLFFLALAAQAHEIGTTRVTVTFPDPRSYQVEIITDAQALAEKWTGGEEIFLSRVSLQFDGAAVRPALWHDGGTIRLTGAVPDGATHFTWSYGWTFASYALTVGPNSVWLDGGQKSEPLAFTAPARGHVVGQYLLLGFTHILPLGWDHVLFIFGLYLTSTGRRSLLAQVTAFTVAHSITLGLSMFGLIRLSPAIVEPVIWLSILYIFVEKFFLGGPQSWRLALVFSFGLLHGLGFASVLTELGLPRADFLAALLSFNLGVEGAQLAVIGICYFGEQQSANLPFLDRWRTAGGRAAA
jgi:hypothetical protein